MSVTADSIVIRTKDLMSTPLDRDIIILNPGNNNYIGLDQIGRRVWELLETPSGVAELCGRLVQEYAGEPGR